MYDPLIVDVFCRAHADIMPVADAVEHPAARAVGGAREAVADTTAAASATDSGVADEVLALSSLARAVQGDAGLADVGALTWMMLRSVVPSSAMAIFTIDDDRLRVTAEYAAGAHAEHVRGATKPIGSGLAGWVAANRRAVVNADPALDLALESAVEPPLRSALTIPLVHSGVTTGVLSLYAERPLAFTDNQARLLELMAPTLAASIAAVRRVHTVSGTWTSAAAAARRGTADLRLLNPRSSSS
jgi:sigma-B regulation protein RsbU (phosphoserine phosphatase)